MEYYYIPNSPEGVEQNVEDEIVNEISRRKRESPAVAAGVGGAAVGLPAVNAVGGIQQDLLKSLYGRFNEIRNNPEMKAQEMKNLIKTYNNYLEQTNNPIEYFVDNPGKNYWAAGTDRRTGEDYVFWDSTAPHAAVMGHELGHIQMNHANPITDPIAGLQTSGIGRLSGTLAPFLGVGGAALGAAKKKTALGQALGGLAGTAAGMGLGSGNFIYEIGGASERAYDYLPDDVDLNQVKEDLDTAGMTYFMGGPGAAGALGLATTAGIGAYKNPGARKYAGELQHLIENTLRKTAR